MEPFQRIAQHIKNMIFQMSQEATLTAELTESVKDLVESLTTPIDLSL